MENVLELFDEIVRLEEAGRHFSAQALREKILLIGETAGENRYMLLCEKLVTEEISVRGVEGADSMELFYLRLHAAVQHQHGTNHALAALAKRKLAKIYAVQGRFAEAVELVDSALPVLESRLGKNSREAREAIQALLDWSRHLEPARAAEFVERIWRQHPLCEHLKRVEDYLLARGVKVLRRHIGNGNEHGCAVELAVDAWLDVEALRMKLGLVAPVEIIEWEDMKSGDGRGFRCAVHGHVIEGRLRKGCGEVI